MIDFFKYPLVLALTGAAVTLLVSFTYTKTQERILDQQLQMQATVFREVIPEAVPFTEMKSNIHNGPSHYWIGVNETDTMYVFKINSQGYSGTMTFLTCIDAQGVIKGIRFLEQNETPGKGTRILEVLSDKYLWEGLFSKNKSPAKPWFCEQFEGISLQKPILIDKNSGEWHKINSKNKAALISRNSITAITGSTISTQAVINGLENQAKWYLSLIQGNRNDF